MDRWINLMDWIDGFRVEGVCGFNAVGIDDWVVGYIYRSTHKQTHVQNSVDM
jgi:hypothetical protein